MNTAVITKAPHRGTSVSFCRNDDQSNVKPSGKYAQIVGEWIMVVGEHIVGILVRN